MTLADGLLDGETIRRLVEEVAHELDSDGVTQHVVIVVGGEVVDAFYAAFPHEPADEHLASFVVTELAKGGFSLPLG